jgi:hypothetical protein
VTERNRTTAAGTPEAHQDWMRIPRVEALEWISARVPRWHEVG